MKKSLLFLMLMAFTVAMNGYSQTCGLVSLIGEFNEWAGDHMMDRSPMNADEWSTIITVTEAHDADLDGFVQLKFRENMDWAMNWGSADFPAGTAVADGDNIPVEYGTWMVMFNCNTGDYEFVSTCGNVSMIGEFNEWAGDYPMMRDMNDPNVWHTIFTVTAAQDTDEDGFIAGKFRENADWAVNWGGADFPIGVGVQDGDNIMIPLDESGITTDYSVIFNCATGAYTFVAISGVVSMIGEFNGWAGDYPLMRDYNIPNMWHGIFTVTAEQDDNEDGFIECKFRENADWTVNWGGTDLPTGNAVQDGDNFLLPLDAEGLTTDFAVSFDAFTGDYSIVATCGSIGMIGGFNNWNGDVPMNRSMEDPAMWYLTRSWHADSEVKFRENADWTANWGDASFPSGTGTPNGGNIPLVAGAYDVTFNCTTFEYNFAENSTVCGEIGMVGDFNEWGDDGTDIPTDVFLERDPMYPNLFSLVYNFTSTTEMLFRIDSDPLFANVWGGTFPTGGGVFGDPNNTKILVPGGKYQITFNCDAGDFHFERLGNAIIAPEVFAINVDGELNEADWNLSQNISRIVMGEPNEPVNEVAFGTAWNADYLYFGIDVKDHSVTEGDTVVVFVDGDKSGGQYDEHDAILIIDGSGNFVQAFPPGAPGSMGEWFISDSGYSVEFAIPWASMGVEVGTGDQVGVDVIIGDEDASEAVAYWMAWNGGLQNYLGSSSFGDCVLGDLACGCISVYNETIGDVVLRNPDEMPTTYVGTYEIFENQDVVFRKDGDNTVFWGSDEFPGGIAELSGDNIPATPGRYRITFDCVSGVYDFTPDETPAAGIAYADRTEEAPSIDGDLSEYTLNYVSDFEPGGGAVNNTAIWGVLWDSYNLYLAVQVEDAIVEGVQPGSPWENDAIEFYFDGNHDQDGGYDADFDTQLIQDFANASISDDTLWIKADGVQFTADQYDAKLVSTASGFNVELRLSWSIFDFKPGKGRTIGFSLGNNDSDNGIGRDYQTVWYGDGNNWSNTAILGDIQMAGGPYFNVKDMFFNDEMVLFPNPTSGNVTIKSLGSTFQGEMNFTVSDISGRTVMVERAIFNGNNDMIVLSTDQLDAGVYFVNVVAADGKKAIKKLIVQ